MTITYSVRPRYTAGSPAGVDFRTAEHVAEQETEAIQHVLEGYVGEEKQAEAEKLGLQRIAYSLKSTGAHFTVLEDLCTGEKIEGWKKVEAELACMGTRRIPDFLVKLIPDWILPAFEQGDLFERREIARLAMNGATVALNRLGQEKLLGFVVER